MAVGVARTGAAVAGLACFKVGDVVTIGLGVKVAGGRSGPGSFSPALPATANDGTGAAFSRAGAVARFNFGAWVGSPLETVLQEGKSKSSKRSSDRLARLIARMAARRGL